jgi:hypothetical protein
VQRGAAAWGKGAGRESELGGSTNTADNAQVLSGEVAVSPRISLFARVFDENGDLV